MKEFKFVKPTVESLKFIADNMRQEDVDEVRAAGSRSPMGSLVRGVKESKTTVVVEYQGVPMVIFGLVPYGLLSGTASPWMLGTDQVVKHKREIVGYTRQVIDAMLLEYSKLVNFAHVKNEPSIKLLSGLGFTFDDPAPHGPHGELFRKFYIERS